MAMSAPVKSSHYYPTPRPTPPQCGIQSGLTSSENAVCNRGRAATNVASLIVGWLVGCRRHIETALLIAGVVEGLAALLNCLPPVRHQGSEPRRHDSINH